MNFLISRFVYLVSQNIFIQHFVYIFFIILCIVGINQHFWKFFFFFFFGLHYLAIIFHDIHFLKFGQLNQIIPNLQILARCKRIFFFSLGFSNKQPEWLWAVYLSLSLPQPLSSTKFHIRCPPVRVPPAPKLAASCVWATC